MKSKLAMMLTALFLTAGVMGTSVRVASDISPGDTGSADYSVNLRPVAEDLAHGRLPKRLRWLPPLWSDNAVLSDHRIVSWTLSI